MLRSLLLVLAVLLGSAQCRSSGPPAGEVLVCEQITPGPPGHTADPQFGNGGHAIVTDLPLSAAGDFFEYQANVTYSVNISGTVEFRGFLVQARDENGTQIGRFILNDPEHGFVNCTNLGIPLETTIGHTMATPNLTESFMWQAPSDANGSVDFRYAIVREQQIFFADQSAAATQPPPDIVAPNLAPEEYNLTFRNPPGCSVPDCAIFAGIDINMGNPEYLDFYLEGDAQSWVAIGFTDSPNMFAADVLACNVAAQGTVEVLDTWNLDVGRGNTRDNIQDVFLFSGSLTDGRISCSFTRSITGSDVPTQDLDLSEDHYVLYGNNPATATPGRVTGHPGGTGNPLVSDTLVNAANLELVIANNTVNPGMATAPVRELEDYRITARFPEDCVVSECDFFVGIDTNDNDMDFLDIYIEGEADGWVAVGFSPTRNMFTTDVLGCSMNPTTGMVEVLDTWNPTVGRNNLGDSLQDIAVFSASSTGGRIACSFARSISGSLTSGPDQEDLSLDSPYLLLLGRSPMSRVGSLQVHLFGVGNPVIPAQMVNPAVDVIDIGATPDPIPEMLTRAHGILMIIAWPIMAVTAIFFAAWMRPALPNGEWFQVHRAFMLGSLFVGAVGFLLIFVAQYQSSPYPGLIDLGTGNRTGTAHFAIGILVMLLHIVNPIISIFRCHPGTPKRWIFDLLHGTFVGLSAEILALVNVGIGLALFSQGFSIFATSFTLAYIYIAWAVFFIAMILVLFMIYTVLALTSTEEGRAKLAPSLAKPLIGSGKKSSDSYPGGVELQVPGQKPPKPAADGRKPPSRDAPLRWVTAAVFALVTLPIMIALIVLVAI